MTQPQQTLITPWQLKTGGWEDLPALMSIYMHPQVNPFLSFEIMDQATFEPIFAELLAAGELYLYCQPTCNKRIGATCIVNRHKRRAAHAATLGTLATHPDYRGQGLGTQFLNEVFVVLREAGIHRLDLQVEADNTAAIGFYQKLGFQPEGTLKGYFKRADQPDYVDELLMARLLV